MTTTSLTRVITYATNRALALKVLAMFDGRSRKAQGQMKEPRKRGSKSATVKWRTAPSPPVSPQRDQRSGSLYRRVRPGATTGSAIGDPSLTVLLTQLLLAASVSTQQCFVVPRCGVQLAPNGRAFDPLEAPKQQARRHLAERQALQVRNRLTAQGLRPQWR